MPLLKRTQARAAPAPEPASRPAPAEPQVRTADEERAAVLAEIAAIRREIEVAENEMDHNNRETNMADNINNSLSVEERELIKKFRQDHQSAAEQRQKFIVITDKPVGQWSPDDYQFIERLMPILVSGGKLPF